MCLGMCEKISLGHHDVRDSWSSCWSTSSSSQCLMTSHQPIAYFWHLKYLWVWIIYIFLISYFWTNVIYPLPHLNWYLIITLYKLYFPSLFLQSTVLLRTFSTPVFWGCHSKLSKICYLKTTKHIFYCYKMHTSKIKSLKNDPLWRLWGKFVPGSQILLAIVVHK